MAYESFTCPDCGRISYHPEDARNGYCGACHNWTGLPDEVALLRAHLHLTLEEAEWEGDR